jgi:V8-like Glu-specific endopeptidase
MCSNEKFVKQRLNADCTGFLVGEDLVATAGHCIKDKFDCEHFSWVFDYSLKGPEDKSYHIIPKENFYTCKKIVNSVYSRNKDLDFAIIQLDRKVKDRTPLKVRTEGKIKTGEKLAIIGYPSGLPKKFANGAEVIKNESKVFFKANLDSFQVNSGSPVFNEDTGIVEGILVRGDMDYKWAYEEKCNRVNTIKWDCKDRDCRLEDVVRITNLLKLSQS